MKLASAIPLFAALFTSTTRAIVIPGGDTPLFHLVASSTQPAINLLPLRTTGSNFQASLSGNGPIGNFYFYQGVFSAIQPPFPTSPPTQLQRGLINSFLGPTGCSLGGPLTFIQGGSSNKCSRSSTFGIQSNIQNSQLGAKLVFDWVGGFYACGAANDVYYKVDPSEIPSGCTPIDLWTVPVSPVG